MHQVVRLCLARSCSLRVAHRAFTTLPSLPPTLHCAADDLEVQEGDCLLALARHGSAATAASVTATLPSLRLGRGTKRPPLLRLNTFARAPSMPAQQMVRERSGGGGQPLHTIVVGWPPADLAGLLNCLEE